MNAFPFSVYCDVCGGPGVGNASAAAGMWDARATVAHSDPRVCRDYIARARRDQERREQELVDNPPIRWKADA